MRHNAWLVVLTAGAAACGGAKGTPGGSAPAQGGDRPALVAKIDSIISTEITKGMVAGASIAIVKGKDTIAVQSFGKANIELNVPTMAHATYEIGSVTKQFTAAALLQLVEQGKVNLDEDITKYLPGYNSQGHQIPVRRLLDHTSGIKGYTELKAFGPLSAFKLPRDTLVKLFSKEPFDFNPGDEEIYNNSAFFLAGLIIEKVSGTPYEDYIQKNLFDKAGMKDAHYCSESKVYKNQVTGYDGDSAGFVHKAPISHQWPYAAGSICSSAIDLVAWNEALHREGKILGPAMHQEMITPGKLNDGTTLGYGKGIAVYPRVGHKAYHHGGGIPGFLSENIYFPDDSLSVVVLFNSAREGPDNFALAIAQLILGPPAEHSTPMEGDVHRFVGTFAGNGRGRPTEIVVTVKDGKVMAKLPGPPSDSARTLTYIGGNKFAHDEMDLIFLGQNGKIGTLRIDAGYGNNLLKRK